MSIGGILFCFSFNQIPKTARNTIAETVYVLPVPADASINDAFSKTNSLNGIVFLISFFFIFTSPYFLDLLTLKILFSKKKENMKLIFNNSSYP